MDYRELAEQLVDIRHLSASMYAEREVSKAIDGRPFVLSRLYEEGEGTYPKQLRADMGVSTARIAAILNQLEESGYITREEDPQDSRHVLVKLTEEGFEIAHEQRDNLLDFFATLLKTLGPEDAREYVRLQGKMLSAMGSSIKQLEAGVGV